ncbi:M15 family metallopeptidase [Legionella hackeliae]|uniref:Peptidase M15C domain-containing protein n=1 Tax=Legionella hackeliae TaxID=449 RepID=A0A0A8UV28_LEGHA|nr:M15 family metallopeptidase [Legionella hackeliae]KTD15257.1 hypothetical protein Lhac_0099 [Legionella hackeliae]CEK11376.1 conserved protein of unknown function [Legionella hackeliae]STX48148.1 Uncharacterized protein conserved in bacteria [Legionella hackeliae]
MDAFKGDDLAAMMANSTSVFNCREVTNHPGIFSQHSYGRAIDINPKINPYVARKLIIPHSSGQFMLKKTSSPGKIKKNSYIYKVFLRYGWDWGGNWYDVQDYQHFEKRSHSEKRNPYGYPKAKITS